MSATYKHIIINASAAKANLFLGLLISMLMPTILVIINVISPLNPCLA